MKHLKQKIRNDKREFKIVHDGIIVDINNIGNVSNYKVDFDDIRKDEFIILKESHPLVWLFILSGILNVILVTAILTDYFKISFEGGKWIFIGAFSVFVIILATLKDHFQRVNIKTLASNKPLEFIYTKKYKLQVEDFISQIRIEQKEFYKKKYFRIDPIIPFDIQKNRILWLYENEYITESEYRVILTDLENKRIIEGE